MTPRALLEHDAIAGPETLELTMRDSLSELFELTVVFSCPDADLDLAALIGTTARARLVDAASGGARLFHGVVDQAAALPGGAAGPTYSLRLRPAVASLARNIRSRVFEDVSVPEIVRDVLARAGLPDEATRFALVRDYPKRELCLQYEESDLAFVMRLCEDEGIFFRFEHGESGHVMVLADDATDHQALDGDSVLPVISADDTDREGVLDLVRERQLCVERFVTRDFSWREPARPLEESVGLDTGGAWEIHEYPGGFDDEEHGLRLAEDRLAAATLDRETLTGVSTSPGLAPGALVEIVGVPSVFDGGYLIVAVDHRFDAGGGAPDYRARFRAIPLGVTFRPPRRTPRPRITGCEIGLVIGPPGETTSVDEMGRVKVRFAWSGDAAAGGAEAHTTGWIRVQQENAPGGLAIPRVGSEVAVGFLDGDPDRPLVLQQLYSEDRLPPYPLPESKAQTILGSSPGGNEIRFDDTPGQMELAVHAARDMSTAAAREHAQRAGRHAVEKIGGALEDAVGGGESVTVGGGQRVSARRGHASQVGGNDVANVGADDDWAVAGNLSLANGGERADTVGGARTIRAGRVIETFAGPAARTVGGASAVAAGGDLLEAVGGPKHESTGGAKIELVSGAKREQVGTSKVLRTGRIETRAGGDIDVTAPGGLSTTVGGAVEVACDGDFTLTARTVKIGAAEGARLAAGGSVIDARGGRLDVTADSVDTRGGATLKLKGRINYKTGGVSGNGGAGGARKPR